MEILKSRSLYFAVVQRQRLKRAFGPSGEVCARTFLPAGAVSSSMIFQTLPGPSPVLVASQPAGSSPIVAFSKFQESAAEVVAARRTASSGEQKECFMETFLSGPSRPTGTKFGPG